MRHGFAIEWQPPVDLVGNNDFLMVPECLIISNRISLIISNRIRLKKSKLMIFNCLIFYNFKYPDFYVRTSSL